MPLRVPHLLAVTAAATLAAACTTPAHRAAQARAAHLAREVPAVRYDRPVEEVWGAVKALLTERGYPLAAEDAAREGLASGVLVNVFTRARRTRIEPDGSWRLETGWLAGVRYRAEALPGPAGVRVALTRFEEDRTEHGRDRTSARDPELELELARRLAPEAAERIARGLPDAPAP
jgi:hypothetical protein